MDRWGRPLCVGTGESFGLEKVLLQNHPPGTERDGDVWLEQQGEPSSSGMGSKPVETA